MPLYEYECEACGCRFEVIHKFSDALIEICQKCGKGPVRKLMSSPAIQFKGSGFYITDYAQKGKPDSGKPDSSSTSSESKSANGAKADSKSMTTSDSSAAKSGTSSSATKPSTGGTSKESKE